MLETLKAGLLKVSRPFQKWSPELRIFAGVQRETCSKKWKKNLGLGPRVGRSLTKNSGEIFLVRLGYFSVISITEVRLGITQPDEKWSPKLRIFAGVQRESCSKKWKKILGLGPNVGRRLTKNSGDAGLYYFSVISLNRRNNPAWQKVFAKVENFRRSTTRKLLEKMKKKFGSWSRCAEMLNEKLRRSG